MYKAKLQELCQKNKWDLPKYSCMKCGPDHDPRFGASVSVNSTSFDSLIPCKSSKQAHNHVAMLAFLHFTSSPAPTTSTLTTSSGSEPAARGPMNVESSQNLEVNSNVSAVNSDPSKPIIKTDKGGPKDGELPQSLKIQSDAAVVVDDIHCQFKIQLQKYARRKELGLPSYSVKCEGPHASCFKAKVTVGECSFESLKFFKTSKEAENSAAKAALMSLLIDNFQKEESSPYKNLLQELAQGEGFCMPLYKTTNSGSSHKPVFKTTVDLEGEIFHGKAANSKKQAEQDAARVAYVALMERASNRVAELSASLDEKTHDPKSSPRLRNIQEEYLLVPYPSQIYVKDVKEDKEECSLFHATNTTEKPSLCSESAASSPLKSVVSSSISNSNVKNKMPSYLLCNKVRVYQEFPNQPFPRGITVLPIGDHKWVAVSLEFPNEESI